MSRPYPRTSGERDKLREAYREKWMADAAERVYQLHQSVNCRMEFHAPEGCANAGDGCLCVCHDVSGSAGGSGEAG